MNLLKAIDSLSRLKKMQSLAQQHIVIWNFNVIFIIF